GRPQRNRRLPARYRDFLPEGTSVVVALQQAEEQDIEEQDVEEQGVEEQSVPNSLPRRVTLNVRPPLKTQRNRFGLWREYIYQPSHDPDGEVRVEDMSNLPPQDDPNDSDDSDADNDTPLNPTQTLLTGWQNNGNSTKSHGEMDKLADILRHPDFDVSELEGYSARTANARLTKADEDHGFNKLKDSFTETSVDIEVPSGDKTIPPRKFSIPGLLYR
ncbi:hypothetical protein EV361DRAFT_777714, partial [Lentinula raphanica]